MPQITDMLAFFPIYIAQSIIKFTQDDGLRVALIPTAPLMGGSAAVILSGPQMPIPPMHADIHRSHRKMGVKSGYIWNSCLPPKKKKSEKILCSSNISISCPTEGAWDNTLKIKMEISGIDSNGVKGLKNKKWPGVTGLSFTKQHTRQHRQQLRIKSHHHHHSRPLPHMQATRQQQTRWRTQITRSQNLQYQHTHEEMDLNF